LAIQKENYFCTHEKEAKGNKQNVEKIGSGG